MKKFPPNDGQEIITTNIDWIQTAKEEALKDRHTDWFTDGIVSQSSGTPFAFTSNGDGTISIGSGVGYISGERIAIEDTDETDFDSTLPDQVTSDNIGGDTPTPKSTGCKNITVPISTTYHIGIKYLLICDSSNTTSPTNYALHPITSKRLFYKWDDGYEIQVNTVKANLFDGDSDYLYLGYVTRGTGTDISLYMIDRSICIVKGSLLLGQTVLVEDGAITGVKLANSVAGNGLSKDAFGDLQVNVDDSTIEINADNLRVKDLGITTAKLNSLAVTEGKIGALAVTETKIGADAVTEDKIKDGAVTEDKIGALAVVEGKIGALAVTEGKIGASAVTEGKIGALAVTEGKIGDRAVSSGKIGLASINVDDIAYKAGDSLILSADTERSTTSIVPEKKKEITIVKRGALRVKFSLLTDNTSYNVYGRVYLDGVAIGTTQSTKSGAYVEKSDDVSGLTRNGKLQLYIWNEVATVMTGYCKNFRIYEESQGTESVDID